MLEMVHRSRPIFLAMAHSGVLSFVEVPPILAKFERLLGKECSFSAEFLPCNLFRETKPFLLAASLFSPSPDAPHVRFLLLAGVGWLVIPIECHATVDCRRHSKLILADMDAWFQLCRRDSRIVGDAFYDYMPIIVSFCLDRLLDVDTVACFLFELFYGARFWDCIYGNEVYIFLCRLLQSLGVGRVGFEWMTRHVISGVLLSRVSCVKIAASPTGLRLRQCDFSSGSKYASTVGKRRTRKTDILSS